MMHIHFKKGLTELERNLPIFFFYVIIFGAKKKEGFVIYAKL